MPSSRVYRMWAAIHAVGAAGERRVWSSINGMTLFPNLYIFLAGPPGVGKSVAINPVSDILRKSMSVRLAPNDISKQGLLDTLAESTKCIMVGAEAMDYHFMAICISELSNFMSQYDHALAGLLTDLFDCPEVAEEKKRGNKGDPIVIKSPGISFIMGTSTQNLGETITDAMWGSGFMARVILVYSDDVVRPPNAETMFNPPAREKHLAEEIEIGLKRIGELKGEMIWDFAAQQAIYHFWTRDNTGPIHNRLAHYNTRRWIHLAKLCMIHALSDERMIIEMEDFNGAKEWLLAAEANMNEIFKDMVSHEDGQIYEEMKQMVFNIHLRTGKQAVPRELIIRFLSRRTSTHNVARIMDVAEAGGYIIRSAGTSGDEAEYIPGKMDASKDAGIL